MFATNPNSLPSTKTGATTVMSGRCVPPEHLTHHPEERAEVQWNVLGLGNDLALPIEDRRRAVPALLDVARIGRANEGHPHLFCDGHEGGAQDLEGDAVHHAAPIMRNPCSSTTARWPGSTSVVLSNCSITAGPSTSFPARSRGRSYTRHSTRPPASSKSTARDPLAAAWASRPPPGSGTRRGRSGVPRAVSRRFTIWIGSWLALKPYASSCARRNACRRGSTAPSVQTSPGTSTTSS